MDGGTNTFVYVEGNPNNKFDPEGLDTFGLSFNLNLGWGAGSTFGGNIVFDDDGNVGVQTVGGVGGDSPGASVTVNAEGTTADTILDLEGPGSQVGIDGGEVLVGELGAMYGVGYSGINYGAGLGCSPIPFGVSGYYTHTDTVEHFNIFEILETFGIK